MIRFVEFGLLILFACALYCSVGERLLGTGCQLTIGAGLGEVPLTFYVISMPNEERARNIMVQFDRIYNGTFDSSTIETHVVDAVVGADLNVRELIEQQIISDAYDGNGDAQSAQRKGEYGCYLSHLKVYHTIKTRNRPGYSVCFEDDFNIVEEDFVTTLREAIESMRDKDFDLMYLGTNYENRGTSIQGRVFNIDKSASLFGAHAILINNRRIDHIIAKTQFIKMPIDVRLEELCRTDQLTCSVIYPHLVYQQFGVMRSTITG